jgi:hypothetical protein
LTIEGEKDLIEEIEKPRNDGQMIEETFNKRASNDVSYKGKRADEE